MSTQNLLFNLKKYLSPIDVKQIEEGGEIYFEKKEVNLLIGHLKREFNFQILLDITAEDLLGKKNVELEHKHRFEVVYTLLSLAEHFRLRIRVPLDEDVSLKTIKSNFPNAEWFENEVWDMFGIQIDDQNQTRILNHKNFKGFPLRKDFVPEKTEELFDPIGHFDEEESVSVIERGMRSVVNIGPIHPITKGSVRAVFELDGEEINRNFFEIGYNHRCIEKTFETHTWSQGLLIAEELSENAPFNASFAYAYGVEKLYNLEIPDRAKALRMVFSELSRITDHFNCLADLSLSSGNETIMFKCFDLRERIYELFEKASGNRIRVPINVLGGVLQDLPLGWISDCFTQMKYIEDNLLMIDKLMTRSKIWMSRSNVCKIDVQTSLEYGFTGPCLRASGINYDLRKVSPYYFYNDVEFEIPLGVNGFSYDRYLVRLEEIRQSLKIIFQILDNLPMGNIIAEHPLTQVFSSKKEARAEGHKVFLKNSSKLEPKKVYSAIESSNGELGFYMISDGSEKPWRIKVRSPSMSHLQGLSSISNGMFLEDVLVGYSSLNISTGELDR